VTGALLGAAAADTRVSPPATAAPERVRGRFSGGSVVQLAGGRWKRMDQLSEGDFVHSAAVKPGTQLELIAVAYILQNHDRNTVIVGFQLPSYQIQACLTPVSWSPG